MTPGESRKRLHWPVVTVAFAIGAATLYPTAAVPVGGGNLCILCGERGLADFLLNVVLFVPFGLALRWDGFGLARAAALGLAFTMMIEASQVWLVAGRDASAGDLVANFLGTVLGWSSLYLSARLRRGGGRWPERVVAPATALLWLLALTLTRPDPQQAIYFTQWVADFGNMERYQGRVLSSRVGEIQLGGPPWRIPDSDGVRERLRDAAPIGVVFVAGPPPIAAAPIFSIYDENEQEVLLLGADGTDVIYRERILAHRLRLDQPTIRFAEALAGVTTGQPVDLVLERDPRRRCVRIRGGATVRPVCEAGFNVADTWQLLYSRDVSDSSRMLAGIFWLFGTSVILAFVAGGRIAVPWLANASIALWILPRLLGFGLTPPLFVVSFAAGFLVLRVRRPVPELASTS